MLDFIFTIGQAAAAMLLIYGGYLTLLPAKRPVREDEPLLLRHLSA
jgi:hypothetical protein